MIPSVLTILAFHPLLPALLLGVVGTALIGWGISHVMQRRRVPYASVNRSFCRRLGVTGRRRRMLDDLARRADLPCAASLLVSRGCFDEVVKRTAIDARLRPHLQEVRRQVFGR